MNVTVVKEWKLPTENENFRKSNSNNSLFYVVRLQQGRHRYLKIGTTEKTIKQRFSANDYKKYSTIKFLYVAEVTTDKNPKDACYHVEDLTRSAIRETKGFTFVKNDRFKYFNLPKTLKIYTNLSNFFEIPLAAQK